jgi:RNA polymerase sigma-70 factor (ECF subfamily)
MGVNVLITERGRCCPEVPCTSRLAEFEDLYRSQAQFVTAFFARRTRDPQLVADLTADTFVEAIGSFHTFDPSRGAVRPWLFGIARHVYAKHCQLTARRLDAAQRDAARRVLDAEEIDDDRDGRELLGRLARLSSADRAAIELVDLVGLTPREAAQALNLSPGVLRVRLFRARARLRKEWTVDAQI